jgi:trehalose 6-phosphate phosphatase
VRAILGPAGAAALAELAVAPAVLAFDFDGTLAPIVARRGEAAMRRATAARLAELGRRWPCAVISGRARADLAARLGGAPVRWLIGGHGGEPDRDGAAPDADLVRIERALGAALAGRRGVELEVKPRSVAIHYRAARPPGVAHAAIVAAVARLDVLVRAVPGKRVVDVLPAGAPTKGDALARLLDATGAARALYVGDDVTDEDVFALARPGLLSVRVGRARRSAAAWYLRDQRAIDALLDRLIALRPALAGLDATG